MRSGLRTSRPVAIAFVAIAAGLALAAFAATASAGVRKGDRVSDFVQVVDRTGKRVSLKQYQGQVVVVTFGASWCDPCKKELPALERLARRYQKRRARVAFLAVNIDNERTKGARFMKQAGLRAVRAVFDRKKSTVESFDPPKMPTTFILRGGVARSVHAGYAPGDEKKLAGAIDRELAAARAPR